MNASSTRIQTTIATPTAIPTSPVCLLRRRATAASPTLGAATRRASAAPAITGLPQGSRSFRGRPRSRPPLASPQAPPSAAMQFRTARTSNTLRGHLTPRTRAPLIITASRLQQAAAGDDLGGQPQVQGALTLGPRRRPTLRSGKVVTLHRLDAPAQHHTESGPGEVIDVVHLQRR